MAMRAGLTRQLRCLSTSFFTSKSLTPLSSQFTTDATATATPTAANDEPAPSTTLFVAGLNKKTSSEQLHKAFSKFGELEQVRVVTDHDSAQSRGFGFVTYATLDDSAKGLQGMDTQELDGWTIFVQYARPKTPPRQLPFGRADHRMQYSY
ncbi:organelle RRM domain-containing protein 2, mitochondrial-like [Euphorbia lathyris]|uniref:organelle RRM domain-containing protein 2, mitochondrial-like n=1 Tax=Euphorbia lathyris TaxID=212925 RepID=UPI00331433FD